MKKILLIAILFLFAQNLFSQDKIFIKGKDELNVKIFEQTDKLIKYKLTDYFSGPIFSMKINKIEKIEYENGLIDLLGAENPRNKRPLGINTGLAIFTNESDEGAILAWSTNYFISPQINLQLNLGYELEYSALFSLGAQFHLNYYYSKKKITPFTGLLFGRESTDTFFQIPIGLHYIGKKGQSSSLSINQMLYSSGWESTLIEVKLGWQF